jgi:hypothetical protein
MERESLTCAQRSNTIFSTALFVIAQKSPTGKKDE